MIKSVYIMVMDGVGVGEAPDAKLFGDEKSNTFLHAVKGEDLSKINTLLRFGMVKFTDENSSEVIGAYGKMQEKSVEKDTTTGHWELAGVVTSQKHPTYPNGFPRYITDALTKATGYEFLGNKPASGTEIINEFGEEHLKTGKLILYTSGDSVMQIAAHEDVISVEELYRVCLSARKIMTGKDACGRIIARPFKTGENGFVRTSDRKDFALEPGTDTLLDVLQKHHVRTTAVGKIGDIFCNRGIDDNCPVHGNKACLDATEALLDSHREGLIFVNLVDFDMVYGHRNDKKGFFGCLAEFSDWLEKNLDKFDEETLLLLVADHGCDPTDVSTDHTREYVPVIAYRKGMIPSDIGTRTTFADISATVLDLFGIETKLFGTSFADKLQ